MTRRLTAVDLLRERIDALENKLAASEALFEGMTTEAKRHAERAAELEADLKHETNVAQLHADLADCAKSMNAALGRVLARAHAEHMFGDRPGCDDRMAALGYLRNHGLPEATPADLDAACEGLETPWGSGPVECEACASILRIYGGNPPGAEHAQVMCRDHDQHGRPRETDTEDIDF